MTNTQDNNEEKHPFNNNDEVNFDNYQPMIHPDISTLQTTIQTDGEVFDNAHSANR